MIITIIALLLIIIPLDRLILLVSSDLYILAHMPMIIGYVIYILNSKQKNTIKKILIGVGIFTTVASLLAMCGLSNVTGGLDSIGGALAYGIAFRFGNIIAKIIAVILLIIDNKKHIFSKKVIILSIIIVLIYLAYMTINTSLTTIKADANIPKVSDFEKELIERGLLSESSDYKLYGLKQQSEKGIALNFKENGVEQFPLYVYVPDKSLNSGKNQWIIYYINGEIFAIWGCYYESLTPFDNIKEEKIIFDYPYEMKTENSKITTYNVEKNRFETSEYITIGEHNYYSQDKSDISVFLDIPVASKSKYFIINFTDRIDAKSLRMELKELNN